MNKRNYLILVLLALVFAAPGVTAYFYFRHPELLGAKTTNKGKLINPPVHFLKENLTPAKWRLILWHPAHCEATCLETIDKLARIRLALGRRLYQVEQSLVLANQEMLPQEIKVALQEQDIRLLYFPNEQTYQAPLSSDEAKIYIANPQGYLVLAFSIKAKSQDIYHDLKQLLSTEKKSD